MAVFCSGELRYLYNTEEVLSKTFVFAQNILDDN